MRLPRSRLPARRMTSAGEPSLGLLALKLQRRQAGRSLAMTKKERLRMTRGLNKQSPVFLPPGGEVIKDYYLVSMLQ